MRQRIREKIHCGRNGKRGDRLLDLAPRAERGKQKGAGIRRRAGAQGLGKDPAEQQLGMQRRTFYSRLSVAGGAFERAVFFAYRKLHVELDVGRLSFAPALSGKFL